MRDSRWNTLVAVGLALFGALLAAFLVCIVDTNAGEAAGALGNVLGGAIGAGGAAIAVYLTLDLQKKDEIEKANDAVVREVVGFVTYIVSTLDVLMSMRGGGVVPMADFPTVVPVPDPTIYPTIAHQITRLRSAQTVVSFYTRIAEGKNLARMIGVRGQSNPTLVVTADTVATVADCWITAAQLAHFVIVRHAHWTGLDEQIRQHALAEIDAVLTRARQAFPNAESFQTST